ncbi:MAG: hypothetical protein H0T89_31730 [Deltaproteobacteria bacterium]|nr:hypothetical protein [Deltaproteobacteria bacterium]MDQ3298643.1 hypothetical protein [Myxococcota bacterium]
MSGRSRPPTDETRTKIFDSNAPRSAPASAPESTSRPPTSRPPTPVPTRTKGPTRQGYESGSVVVPKLDEFSITPEPLRAISMKSAIDRAKPQAPKQFVLPKQHKPEIRSLEDVSKRAQTVQTSGTTGRIAPPREAKGVRARKLRDVVFWGSVVVIIGSVVMLAVWFIAR